MERLSITPRTDWQTQVELSLLSFHTNNFDTYWDESACYYFEAREIDAFEKATNEIEKMCMAVVDNVIQHQRYCELNIPEFAWPLIESSWQRGDKNLYGRLDLSYNGIDPPKLLEYNADTPITLPETSIIQRQWLKQVRPNSQQYNNLHERLVAAWRHYGPGPIHLTCLEQFPEMFANTAYMAEIIREASLTAKQLSIEKVLWDGQYFLDTENTPIRTLFKLYPWEWLLEGEYHKHRDQKSMRIIAPAWEMILGNKGLLVLLWEMFPDHPNLLPAFFDHKHFSGNYVKKPFLGMQGQNISIFSDQGNTSSDGDYAEGPFIYQQWHPLPNFDGNYPVVCSWLIAGEAAGIGVREDSGRINNMTSRFVPHFFD